MSDKLITICVCAYNMEELLPRALDSCLIPGRDQLEVLIMNDGSTDRTGEIADAYAQKYPETFVHVRKENGGWGSNLNLAVKMARGKYFKELDADDWYVKENLQRLVKTAGETDADLLITDHVYCYPDHERENHPAWKRYAFQERKMADTAPFYFPIWDAAYKTEVLKSHYTDLPKHMPYTDNLFILYILPYLETVRFDDYVLYCYMLGRDGQSVDIRSLRKHINELMLVQKLSFDFLEHEDLARNPHVLSKVMATYNTFFSYLLRLYKNCSCDIPGTIKENDLYIRTHLPELYRAGYKNKKLFLLRASGYRLVFLSAFIQRVKDKTSKR